jgi:hypothetical protein
MTAKRRRRPNSVYMAGTPLRSHGPVNPQQAADIITASLQDCTCQPIIHTYDMGHGETGIALLHDPDCTRLAHLKSETN